MQWPRSEGLPAGFASQPPKFRRTDKYGPYGLDTQGPRPSRRETWSTYAKRPNSPIRRKTQAKAGAKQSSASQYQSRSFGGRHRRNYIESEDTESPVPNARRTTYYSSRARADRDYLQSPPNVESEYSDEALSAESAASESEIESRFAFDFPPRAFGSGVKDFPSDRSDSLSTEKEGRAVPPDYAGKQRHFKVEMHDVLRSSYTNSIVAHEEAITRDATAELFVAGNQGSLAANVTTLLRWMFVTYYKVLVSFLIKR